MLMPFSLPFRHADFIAAALALISLPLLSITLFARHAELRFQFMRLFFSRYYYAIIFAAVCHVRLLLRAITLLFAKLMLLAAVVG